MLIPSKEYAGGTGDSHHETDLESRRLHRWGKKSMRTNARSWGVSSTFAPIVLATLVGIVDLYGSSTLAQGDAKADQKLSQDTSQRSGRDASGSDRAKDADPNGSSNGSTSSASANQVVDQPGAELVTSTSAKLSNALEEVPTRRLRFTINTRQEFNRGDIDNDDTANRLGVSFVAAAYSLTPTKTIQLRQEFWYQRPDKNGPDRHTVRDLFIGFNNMSLGKFWDNGTLMSMTRLYFPTGEESRFITKQNGTLLQWFIANKPVGKFEFDYHLIGVYFNQTQNTYIGPKGKPVANLDYDIETWLSAKYNFTPWLNVFQTAGVDSIWRRPMDGPGIQRMQFAEMETGVTVMPMPNITVIASLFNYANIFDSKNAYYPWRDDETVYRLVLSATM